MNEGKCINIEIVKGGFILGAETTQDLGVTNCISYEREIFTSVNKLIKSLREKLEQSDGAEKTED